MTTPEQREHRPFNDLRASGLLWLINRVVFHPRGHALALVYPAGADTNTQEPIGWRLLGDGSEVWAFGEPEDDLFNAAQQTLAAHLTDQKEATTGQHAGQQEEHTTSPKQ